MRSESPTDQVGRGPACGCRSTKAISTMPGTVAPAQPEAASAAPNEPERRTVRRSDSSRSASLARSAEPSLSIRAPASCRSDTSVSPTVASEAEASTSEMRKVEASAHSAV